MSEKLNRREALAIGFGVGTAALVASCSKRSGSPNPGSVDTGSFEPDPQVFPEGVIAGDPMPDGAVIWTRVAAAAGINRALWQVSKGEGFEEIARSGEVEVSAEANFTVKAAVDALDSDSWYFYRFLVGKSASRVGRLRTAPVDYSARVRFGFGSCQQLSGVYAAHRAIAQDGDLDFFVHLGDYIYVNDEADLTLEDYRNRWRTFKAQPLLQDMQARVPLVAMWDDGEFYNGIDRTGAPERLLAAKTAWFENMPVIAPDSDPLRAYRRLGWSSLADVFMIDVRAYRDPAIDPYDTNDPAALEMFDARRSTLGAQQRDWLLAALSESSAAQRGWRIIGNPYNLAMWRLVDTDTEWPRAEGSLANSGVYAPNEAWDDYQAERRTLLEYISTNNIDNVLSCSAHTHIFFANELLIDPDDPSAEPVAFDFTAGSLTADPDLLGGLEGTQRAAKVAGFREQEAKAMKTNPWMKFGDLVDQGYGVVELTPERAKIEFWFVDPFDESEPARLGARFVVEAGSHRMSVDTFDQVRRI